jgi:predicted RNA-binding Zn ribbon-like protein
MAKTSRPAPVPAESVDADRVLAFINTLSGRPTPAPVERLDTYQALVEWAREQHLVSAAAAERLAGEAKKHPHQAAAVLARAKDFREALNGLAAAIDSERQPHAEVLGTIGECLAGAYANGRLVPHEGALQWVARAEDDLERVLWEIGRAAGRLVISTRLARVRACAASDCGWWFVDDTKNRSRRWCDMKLCGNREKLRRFRSRGSSGSKGSKG